ncbi:unnamed protein product [Brassica rapa]|uniref:Uncharacterized protein n=1 Tax=Brassica campestris TaxID=3711 RepID=A0A8D9H0F6_BRACM|nr:unnamed protein product [Brassica rapa]
MVNGEDACWRLIPVGFVALAIESIYIEKSLFTGRDTYQGHNTVFEKNPSFVDSLDL